MSLAVQQHVSPEKLCHSSARFFIYTQSIEQGDKVGHSQNGNEGGGALGGLAGETEREGSRHSGWAGSSF